MASSTIVSVKSALRSLLSGTSTLHGVPVFYGAPTGTVPDEFILVGDVEGSQEAEGIKSETQPRRENYSVQVLVSVVRTTQDQSSVDARCIALVSEVEDALRADVTLSATYSGPGQLLWAQFGGVRLLQELVTDDGLRREARATCAVEVAARI